MRSTQRLHVLHELYSVPFSRPSIKRVPPRKELIGAQNQKGFKFDSAFKNPMTRRFLLRTPTHLWVRRAAPTVEGDILLLLPPTHVHVQATDLASLEILPGKLAVAGVCSREPGVCAGCRVLSGCVSRRWVEEQPLPGGLGAPSLRSATGTDLQRLPMSILLNSERLTDASSVWLWAGLAPKVGSWVSRIHRRDQEA